MLPEEFAKKVALSVGTTLLMLFQFSAWREAGDASVRLSGANPRVTPVKPARISSVSSCRRACLRNRRRSIRRVAARS